MYDPVVSHSFLYHVILVLLYQVRTALHLELRIIRTYWHTKVPGTIPGTIYRSSLATHYVAGTGIPVQRTYQVPGTLVLNSNMPGIRCW